MTWPALRSLRQRVWPAEQAEVGEALRDLHSFCERLTLTSIAQVNNAVWAEPFSFALERRPQLLLLADARVAGTLTSVETGAIDWQVDIKTNSVRARVNRAATLVPGKSYDLKFLVVY